MNSNRTTHVTRITFIMQSSDREFLKAKTYKLLWVFNQNELHRKFKTVFVKLLFFISSV